MSLTTVGQGLWSAIRSAINSNFNFLKGEIDALSDDSHTHDNKTILDNTTASFTTAKETKLANISERFRGVYENIAAADADIPNPEFGYYFLNSETVTLWSFNATDDEPLGEWIDTEVNSAGDMLSNIYDPEGVGSDAFDRSNHTGVQSQSTIDGLTTVINDLISRLTVIEADYDDVKAVTVDSGSVVLLAVASCHANSTVTMKYSRSGSGTATYSAKTGYNSETETGQGYRNLTIAGYAPDSESYDHAYHLATPSSERDNLLAVYSAQANNGELARDGSDITFRIYSNDDSTWDDPVNADMDDQAVTIAIYGVLS